MWIALDLYLWNIEHSFALILVHWRIVVNCSRFVSLKYWTQLPREKPIPGTSCELLSICIFEILNTALILSQIMLEVLWIALDLYLWNIEHSVYKFLLNSWLVVNCSRFVSLKYWTQLYRIPSKMKISCELLSICIFEILNTAKRRFRHRLHRLWIALDLYLWNIEHSVFL